MFGTDGEENDGPRSEKTPISDNDGNSNNDDGHNGGVVLESKDNVRVTDTYDENEKIVGIYNDSEIVDKFGISDLVWGKVRSHPWWPGQIFDPSDASEKAQKYSKKDGILIAYFSDKTFAWNEESKIKPFRDNFASMETQSKTEAFSHAVKCALGEISRRVEFGLACKCLSEEVYDEIKTQTIVNAGIREESRKREGGDRYSSAESFVPLDLVGYVENLAKFPCAEANRLEFVTARAQLLSFNRHKGLTELPEYQMFDYVSIENSSHLGKEIGTKVGSKKRKIMSSNSVSSSEKEKNMSDLKAESYTSASVKKYKADTYITDNTMVEDKKELPSPVTRNQFSDIGKRICSVIPVLKEGGNGGLLGCSRKKPGRKKAIPAEQLSSDEILSHLSTVARSPIKGYSSLRSSISLLSDMRNLSTLKISSEYEKEIDKSSSKEDGEDLSKVEIAKDSGVEGFEDSYWTDRVVLSTTQEEILFEPEIQPDNAPDGNGITSAESDLKIDPQVEIADHVHDKCEEENPTALILNFSDIDSVPSQQNLNNIFRRYGPLMETNTEVVKKGKRAKVIFKRRSDAETAFSSSGKFSIFGPSLVSYRLHYMPFKQEKDSPAKKRSKKGAKSVESKDG